ncbi:stationary phase survival protein SurE [Amycolatopsis roodepoortensis]|uniref:5'/3'-nucleotidase SurE n=1 Tax=Amycolatopsis roodepoortensis TaxID=700274 RepID=UPI00214C2BDC|nr:5'/3'-nucleotidase SurE [Amycolatopsis roodepoortensis]UUV31506.1 stationary phase survival protein SurE [Amycolatopsis roodepoortensis]
MKTRSALKAGALLAATATVVLTGASGAVGAPAAPLAGMRVLLGNDDSMQAARPDGADGIGLYDLRKRLCAAGADVVVVAPWAYMSGASGAVTTGGTVSAQRRTAMPAGYQQDCGGAPGAGAVFGLCRGASPCTPASPSATPADTVKFALRGGLGHLVGWREAPDVVVTGINSGPNVSSAVNDSGTVGAAIAALDGEVPAVAFSGMVGDGLVVGRKTYEAAAEFGARLLTRLRQRDLLSPRFALNVNYPDAARGKASRVSWTSMGTGPLGVATFTPVDADTFTLGLGLCPADRYCLPETKRDSDTEAIRRGEVSITPITADRTLPGRDADRVRAAVTGGRLPG